MSAPEAGSPLSHAVDPFVPVLHLVRGDRAGCLAGLGPLQARLAADGDRAEDRLELKLLQGPEVTQPARGDAQMGVGARPGRAADLEVIEHTQVRRVGVVFDRLTMRAGSARVHGPFR